MRALFKRGSGSASGSGNASASGSPNGNPGTNTKAATYPDDVQGLSLEDLVRGASQDAQRREQRGAEAAGPTSVPKTGVPGPSNYGFHSMALQIKDPEQSIPFYEQALGMRLVKHSEADDYSMYFLTFANSTDDTLFGQQRGMIQLIHVHGTEHDPSFRVSASGPGFTHLTISVPDVEKARQRMESLGVPVIEDGSNARGFAAVCDPDGYSIQLISQSEGQDDLLRAQLEQLMNESMAINLNTPPAPKKQATAAAQQATENGSSADDGDPASRSSPMHVQPPSSKDRALQALLMAKGGSPILSPATSPKRV